MDMDNKKLKEIIAEKGIKQSFIASKLGVSRALVNQWVKDLRPIPDRFLLDLKRILN